ncbi:MAG: TIGR02556 family CRISPR-associated protein [Candidatus Kapaibacterium sp.]|nr:MAG: TIGR02556 family CRISPR-associated protein [Candidatus Kapabacteria bacterium]
MIHQLEKIARQPIPDHRTATGTLDYRREYNDKQIIFIDFDFDDTTATFTGITVTEFKPSNAELYLWQTYSANASPKFPTLQIFNKKAPKDLYDEATGAISLSTSKKAKKLLKCLKEFPKINAITEQIEQNQDIAQAVDAAIQNIDEFVLSLRINGEMVGESKHFAERKASMQGSDIKTEYFTDGGKSHLAQEKLCSITLEKTEVFGYASLYNFYAPKTYPSVVAGGFDSTQSWRNFPTSKNGILALEKAKALIEKELRFRFCGYDYFLLPTPVLNTPNAKFAKTLAKIQGFSLTDDAANTQRNLEDRLIFAFREEENILTLTLFFFEQNKAEFKILAVIEDVFPSYLRTIYDARENVEKLSIFHNLPGKDKTTYSERFDFGLVKHFFSDTQHFLGIVRSVFMQKRLDYSFLLQAIMRRVRSSFVNGERFDLDTLKGYMLLCFLAKLNLLQPFSLQTMNKEISVNAPIEAFFKEHEGFFDYGSPLKRAVFLEGVLAQKLLDVQYATRQSKPFIPELKGLQIDYDRFMGLLSKIRDKLTQYKAFYAHYELIAKAIERYTLHSTPDERKNLSLNECSFYFSLGMLASDMFYKQADEEADKQNIEAE